MKEILDMYATDPGMVQASIAIAAMILVWVGYLSLIHRLLGKRGDCHERR